MQNLLSRVLLQYRKNAEEVREGYIMFGQLAVVFGHDYQQDDTSFYGIAYHYNMWHAVFIGVSVDRPIVRPTSH